MPMYYTVYACVGAGSRVCRAARTEGRGVVGHAVGRVCRVSMCRVCGVSCEL